MNISFFFNELGNDFLNIGIIVFPGSNCDRDCAHVISEIMGQSAHLIWHQETSVKGMDAIILPGGFSYGDYVMAGRLAQLVSEQRLGDSLKKFRDDGGYLLGIGSQRGRCLDRG